MASARKVVSFSFENKGTEVHGCLDEGVGSLELGQLGHGCGSLSSMDGALPNLGSITDADAENMQPTRSNKAVSVLPIVGKNRDSSPPAAAAPAPIRAKKAASTSRGGGGRAAAAALLDRKRAALKERFDRAAEKQPQTAFR